MKNALLLSLLALPLASVQAASVAYRNAVMANNPVAYYEFDEAGGATAADTTGSFDGTYAGSIGYSAASGAPNLGSAIDFTGGHVALPNLGTFGQSTVEVWVQLDSVNAGCCTGILTANGWDTGRLHLNVNSSAFEHAVNADTTVSILTTTTASAGAWYHLVVTNDVVADQTRFYLNGAEVGDTGDHASQNVVFGATGMQIGAWDGARNLDGRIDEVAIYDSVLSPTDVANHFAAASIPEPTGAIMLLLGGALCTIRRRR
jgi:hypothetical protein